LIGVEGNSDPIIQVKHRVHPILHRIGRSKREGKQAGAQEARDGDDHWPPLPPSDEEQQK
jgi:hypothetical protein